MTTTTTECINVALLGAGIFASASHAPAIQKLNKDFRCIAVWSRRLESATKLAATFSPDTQAYTNLDQVLALPDLNAVIMALPIDIQYEYLPKCWAAGKHVLSEKPIAGRTQQAKELLRLYLREYYPKGLVWVVGENFRYEPAMKRAAEIINDGTAIGQPFLFSLNSQAPFTPDNKYLQTTWRRDSNYMGLFTDVFIHSAAMLRGVLLGGTSTSTMSVSALTSSHAGHIPGVDTMAAHITLLKTSAHVNSSNGDNSESMENNFVQGTISVTYACCAIKFELEVIGTGGTLQLSRKLDGPGYRLLVSKKNGDKISEEFQFGGIEGELVAFAAACRGDKHDVVAYLSRATGDLQFCEACLQSGQQNGERVEILDTRFTKEH